MIGQKKEESARPFWKRARLARGGCFLFSAGALSRAKTDSFRFPSSLSSCQPFRPSWLLSLAGSGGVQPSFVLRIDPFGPEALAGFIPPYPLTG